MVVSVGNFSDEEAFSASSDSTSYPPPHGAVPIHSDAPLPAAEVAVPFSVLQFGVSELAPDKVRLHSHRFAVCKTQNKENVDTIVQIYPFVQKKQYL